MDENITPNHHTSTMGLENYFPENVLILSKGTGKDCKYAVAIVENQQGLACFSTLYKIVDFLKLDDYQDFEAKRVTFDEARLIAKGASDIHFLALVDNIESTKLHFVK